MRVAVQHEFGAMLADGALEPADAEEAFVLRDGQAHGRMVDHDDPKQAASAGRIQHFRQPVRTAARERIPFAMNGAVARAVVTPISATSPRTRRYGKAVRSRGGLPPSPVIQPPQARQTLSKAPGT